MAGFGDQFFVGHWVSQSGGLERHWQIS